MQFTAQRFPICRKNGNNYRRHFPDCSVAWRKKGCSVRSIDPKDRRSSYVSLTEAGQERRDQGHCIMEVFVQRVVERMGEGRFRELIEQWERFGDVLETEIAAFRNVDGMEE